MSPLLRSIRRTKRPIPIKAKEVWNIFESAALEAVEGGLSINEAQTALALVMLEKGLNKYVRQQDTARALRIHQVTVTMMLNGALRRDPTKPGKQNWKKRFSSRKEALQEVEL